MKLIGNQKVTNPLRILLAGVFLSVFWYGCGSVGKNFNESLYTKIVQGTTTKNEIQTMFGCMNQMTSSPILRNKSYNQVTLRIFRKNITHDK